MLSVADILLTVQSCFFAVTIYFLVLALSDSDGIVALQWIKRPVLSGKVAITNGSI